MLRLYTTVRVLAAPRGRSCLCGSGARSLRLPEGRPRGPARHHCRTGTAISDKRLIVRNTVFSASMRALQLVTSFVFMPFLLGNFGLANYGIFMLASSVSVYLGLLDFGMSSAVVKFTAEHRARDEDQELGRVISNTFAYYLLVGVVGCLVLLAVARWGVNLFQLSADNRDLARTLFTVSGLIALFSWPLSLGVSVLAGLQRYDIASGIGSMAIVGNVLATLLVVVTGQGPVDLLAAMGVVTIAGGLAYTIAAVRQLGPGVPLTWRLVRWPALKRVFAFSWPLFVIQSTALVSNLQTDRIVLAGFVGPTAVSIYESAAKLTGLVGQLSPLTTAAIVPMASKLDAEARIETLRSLFLRGTKYTVAFVVPVTVGLMMLAEPLLLHWLGSEFAAQAGAARIFLVAWIFNANLTVAFTMFVGTGRVRFLMFYNAGQAVLNLAVSLLLVRQYGVLGVIVGTAAAELLFFPVGMRYVLRDLKVGLRWYLKGVVLKTYPLLVLPVGVSAVCMALGLTSTLSGVAMAGVLSVGVYWAAFYRVGLTGPEREDLTAQLRSALGRPAAERR